MWSRSMLSQGMVRRVIAIIINSWHATGTYLCLFSGQSLRLRRPPGGEFERTAVPQGRHQSHHQSARR